MFLQKRKITLPFGLTITRVISLIIAIVYLISGLGSSTYWALKTFAGKDVEVPFGLSTFRSLQWREADLVLITCCLVCAGSLFREERSLRGYLAGGVGFLSQGVLGLYVHSLSVDKRAEFGVPVDKQHELQPFFLNVWFLVFGSLTVWLGVRGLDFVEKLDF